MFSTIINVCYSVFLKIKSAIKEALLAWKLKLVCSRRSRPRVFCKRGVLRNFPKFTGKHRCQRTFFNKVADLRPATLLKKRFWHRCFPLNFAKYLRTPFLTEHLVATATIPRETWRTLSHPMSNRNFYTSKGTRCN